MSERPRQYDLLEGLLRQMRLPWYGATALISAVLLLSVVLAAYLDGVFSRPFDWSVWRGSLQPPLIITYILVVYPLMQRLWDRTVRALVPLLDLEEPSRNDMVNSLNAVNHRWERLAVAMGALFWIALSQPWNWVGDWLDVYALAVQMIMFGLLGWLVYGGLVNTRQLTKLNRHVKLDINNPGSMAPVAQWSLGISLAFVGGITISVAFQPTESLVQWQTIVTYAVLLSVTILIFFVSLWGTHGAMARAKRSELSLAREHLGAALRELKEKTAHGPAEGIDKLHSAVAAWGTYERSVREAPEWPYNANVLLRLGASALFPTIVYLLKIVFGVRLTP
jgi:hypothetical protein